MFRVVVSIIILLLLSGYKNAHAQNEYFVLSNQNLSQLRYEKIYLHTDRINYSTGDDIWFKTYLLDGKTHIPISGSRTAYIDLVGPGGKIYFHKPFFIENGMGNGNITIGDTLNTGIYTIYAYTNYMRNYGNESFFTKEVTVTQILLDPDKQLVIEEFDTIDKQLKSDPGILLQFMPEGGYLSKNMQNTLAYKITTSSGRGINLKGVIKNDRGGFIDSLHGTHLGMGKINFMPKSDMNYYAVLENFLSDTFPLPPATHKPRLQFKGITDGIVRFTVFNLSPHYNKKPYYLAIKARGQLSFYLERKIDNAMNIINIPLDNFQPGLNQVTMLDNNFSPIAERLFYIPGTQQAVMDIQLAEETFKNRERTIVKLEIFNKQDISAGGSFSMAAINLDQIGTTEIPLDNIISFLELSSEVRGQIETPGYYFSQPYDSVKQNLDLLLLTQGWRKYIWDDQYITSFQDYKYQKESGFTVSGHAQKLLRNKALEAGKIILVIPQEEIILETTTDSTGYYHFDNLVLFDSIKIAVHSRNKNNRENTELIDVNYNIPPPPAFPEPKTSVLNNTDLEAYNIEAYNKSTYPRYVNNSYFDYDKSTILIEEVTIVEDRRKKDNGHFRLHSMADNVIDMDDYPNNGVGDVITFLKGKVSGLYIAGDKISIRGSLETPLILLDGIRIVGSKDEIEILSKVRDIPLDDIDKIEVLKGGRAAIYGMSGGNGVIAIYTKRGEYEYQEYPLFDVISKRIEGYAKAKEFYMPDYENPETNMTIIDHRATVFWAPNLVPDSTGTCTVSYFNSDDMGEIAIIIEGVLNNGKPGVAKAFYRVERE